MEHIFISYSRDDAKFISLLEQELRDRSHHVWLDTTDIQGGTDWEQEIEKAIENSYAIIVVVSKKSVKSEWVSKEIEIVKSNKKEITIIPITIDDTAIPANLARNQSIDFSRMFDCCDIDTIRNYRVAVLQLVASLELTRPLLVLLKKLDHIEGEVREDGARELGELGDKGAAIALISRLEDIDADVRYEAALALGKLEIVSAYKPLVRLIGTEEDPDVIAAISTALGELGLVEAVAPLSEQLKNPDRFVRACAARALGKLKSISTVNALVELLRTDGISDVREAATEALEAIGNRQAKQALSRIAESNLLGRKTETEN